MIVMRRLFLLCLLLLPALPAAAGDVHLPRATDLQALGAEARARNLPILILFSMEHCPWCAVVREEFLNPMLRSGDYTERVIMVELESDASPITDFDGRRIEAIDVAQRYDATLSPTVVFLDGHGRELAPKLVGVTTVDFYGGYLDEGIDTALLRLRRLAYRPPAADGE